LELSQRHERDGLGDAPWPPQYKKQPGEPPRVQPSRARAVKKTTDGDVKSADDTQQQPSPREAPRRRVSKYPLIEIGRAQHKADALAGLERWKARYPQAALHLAPADVLVDAMRGRSSLWTRIRINLQHVPPSLRPVQEALDPNDAPDMG